MSTDPRPIRATIFETKTLATGEVVEVARCQWATGQIVGIGWTAVRINGGEWIPAQQETQSRLVRDLRQCDTIEEVTVLLCQPDDEGSNP